MTAEDCVASLKRWSKIENMGQTLMDFTASLEASDERTITLKLKEPFALVLESLAKPSSKVPFMMPRRLAETPSGRIRSRSALARSNSSRLNSSRA